ncbi:flavin monoamine oxidase family protein [Algoriphagus marinus]|uniref:flavin monoamine oxidase family protein n=1 Tax=Algoriphagus marinus TaxID=1925762 RepID=UPI00094B7942|nr:NAD(P)/FAD-dependent oxidoreductase [Algoriphagus marinus]
MIIIIGAGLSGLLTAYRLKKVGIPFKILEARDRIGGRIHTVFGTNETPMEMGATWFGNQHRHLKALLEELGIEYFEQYMDRTVYYQASPTSPTELVQIPSQAPSYRIYGGSSNLINTLCQKLDKNDIILNQSVTEIKFLSDSVQVIADQIFEGSQVVLAIPPKLWAKRILFEPNLPADLIQIAEQTHTWMEDSIKIALTYKEAFWQVEGQTGTLFSNAGPITEFYDHCNSERTKFALCGFINSSYKQLGDAERRALVIAQIKSVFGPKAEDFMDYQECVWSMEELTFEASDIPHYPHQNNGNQFFRQSFFEDKLVLSSSESASESPGYMDGAVCSADLVAKKIIALNLKSIE